MSQLHLLVVDDEPSVLEIVLRDLAGFEEAFVIETADSAASARERVKEIISRHDRLAVVLCDHVMPGERGVDFLVALHQDKATKATRKILLTGQAGLDATVEAVNSAGLAHYIAKPWKAEEIQEVVRRQISLFVLEEKLDPTPWLRWLDPLIVGEAIHRGLMGDS